MGWFSGIGSAISSAFSSACSVVSSTISSLSSFAVTYGPKIMNSLGIVGQVIGAIAQALGIFKPEEKPEQMGDRALQAAEQGIKPENFDKYDDYLNAIRNFELDPEKSQAYSPEAKQLAGIGVAVKSIEDKFDLHEGTGGMLATMIAFNPEYFNSSRVLSWLNGATSVEKIIAYFDGKLDAADSVEIEGEIVDNDKALTGRDETTIETELNHIKDQIESN